MNKICIVVGVVLPVFFWQYSALAEAKTGFANHIDASSISLRLDVSFTNDCAGATVVFCLSNLTDKVLSVVESSFPEEDFRLRVMGTDGANVRLRAGADAEGLRRSEILRRLMVDVGPRSAYTREGDFISFYDLKSGEDYVAEGSCKVYEKGQKGFCLMGTAGGSVRFRVPLKGACDAQHKTQPVSAGVKRGRTWNEANSLAWYFADAVNSAQTNSILRIVGAGRHRCAPGDFSSVMEGMSLSWVADAMKRGCVVRLNQTEDDDGRIKVFIDMLCDEKFVSRHVLVYQDGLLRACE